MGRKPTLKSARERAFKAQSDFIRQKYAVDGFVNCVSCGKNIPWREADAGHFVPRSRSSALAFMEENVHPECVSCNRFDDGHLIGYTLYMQEMYGKEFVEDLKNNREIVRRRIPDYLEIESYYTDKLADIE